MVYTSKASMYPFIEKELTVFQGLQGSMNDSLKIERRSLKTVFCLPRSFALEFKEDTLDV